ncbi:MAG: glycosyltransferase [Romboutsia timonensis]|uniref:glycosyltransferase family 4 protein n=1 Tax=Romboutsia timonensis TaxID=1776391 RepID=UPI002A75FD29|nr:glycosyltransferase [Romboutsia timonensis]MDY2884039.1 glycosyltransferase [Romboutsia timonensis]
MKILWVTNLPSPYRMDFFNELGKLVDLTVLLERCEADDRDKKWFEIKNKTFKCIQLQGKGWSMDKSISIDIIKYLKNIDYDYCVLGLYSSPTQIIANIYLRILKKQFIISTDGGFIKPDKKVSKLIKSFLISGASNWLSTGKSTTKYLEHYGAKKENIFEYPFTSIRKKDIITLNMLESDEKQKLKKELNIKEKKVILGIGQFIPRKGFDVLIQAMDTIDEDIGCYIIGGIATDEYKNLSKSISNKNIHFIEFQGKKNIEKYYKCADLFVLPTREDIWGLVINEAMAFGLPVITTDKCIAGLELIDNGTNGYIIESDNILQLREKILTILENEKLRKEMSTNSLKIIENYSIEVMAQRHKEIFDAIEYSCGGVV